MNYETLIFEIEDHVATIRLNRPDSRNALNLRLKQELDEIIRLHLNGNPSVRVVVFTGTGAAFCAGTDLRERAAQDIAPAEFISAQRFTQQLFRRIEKLEQPSIAAINGYAFGGGTELALACDLRIAVRDAVLGLTEVGLGIIPMAGGTQRLPRLIGVARAKELILTAARISAERALEIGLVNRVVADDALAAARQLAAELVKLPPLAVRHAKQVIDIGMQADIETSLEIELQTSAILFATEDRKAAMRAFLEKRPATFSGR